MSVYLLIISVYLFIMTVYLLIMSVNWLIMSVYLFICLYICLFNRARRWIWVQIVSQERHWFRWSGCWNYSDRGWKWVQLTSGLLWPQPVSRNAEFWEKRFSAASSLSKICTKNLKNIYTGLKKYLHWPCCQWSIWKHLLSAYRYNLL